MAVVSVVALLAPLAVRLAGIRLPEVVLEVALCVVVGLQVLGWAHNCAAYRPWRAYRPSSSRSFWYALDPAVLYRPRARNRRQVAAAGLLQATSVAFPVAAGAVAVSLHLLRPDYYAASVAAGLLSVIASRSWPSRSSRRDRPDSAPSRA